jgi:type I restriction-modification system DNA methylase subunit
MPSARPTCSRELQTRLNAVAGCLPVAREFALMLSNPPYGKLWKTDLERMGGKGDIKDPRFVIQYAGDPEFLAHYPVLVSALTISPNFLKTA